MKGIIDRLLARYATGEYALALRARFVLYICAAALILLPCIMLYTAYLNLNNPKFGYALNPRVLVPILVSFLLVAAALVLLIKGQFMLAAHFLFIVLQGVVWTVMFNDTSLAVSRTDSIVLLVAVLSMAPVIFTRRPAGFLAYAAANIILIRLFVLKRTADLDLTFGQKWDYFADSSAAVVIIAVVSYALFSINRRAMDRVSESNRELERANEELAATNEELSATNEELESTMEELLATNEEFESQNEELISSQEALMASEAEFRAIFNASHDALIIHDREGRVLEVNDRMLRMYGIDRESVAGLTVMDISRTPGGEGERDGDTRRAVEFWKKALAGEDVLFEWKALRLSDGTAFDVEVGLRSFMRRGQAVILASVRDISERIAAREKLKKSEERYRQLFETANDAIFIMNDEVFLDCNERTLSMFACSREDIIGLPPWKFSPPEQPDGSSSVEAALARVRAAAGGVPQSFSWLHCRKDGTPFFAEVSLNVLEISGGRFIQAIVRDVDEREKANIAMRQSLEEKTVLIREVHHRVKNNMQIISSLLSLQAMHAEEGLVRRQLLDGVGRIHSMAKIHERIYRADNYSRIDMAAYVRELFDDIVHLFSIDAGGIGLAGNLEPVLLGVDQAVPCGLLINEILTNAVKHGRARVGASVIEMHISSGEGLVRLSIADNGPGMDSSVLTGEKAKTVGMQIIHALARQLSAVIVLEGRTGVCYRISFPEKRSGENLWPYREPSESDTSGNSGE